LALTAKQNHWSAHKVNLLLTKTGEHMTNIIILMSLAIVTVACSVLEGLVESLSPQFIQISGLLTIICAGVFIVMTLKVQAGWFKKD
jgi:hypothetical protein